ncbi:hypothetical protein K432DRAFT_399833 [Lepidopterella palustris CBS 459.81]|uniref:Uncharacterized protein n=1 Tax=Lepidopterella palustris CBS 459.81 TaxID=1314670 RepID=A0A8E2EL17_9PEZI|nr:hypothetical protein K432DRAFT_399833 [Lepidopterella palustris CBS 459.81]
MPQADYWDEEDEWYSSDRYTSGARHVRPTAPPRRSQIDPRRSERTFLAPETSTFTHGLHRTRSQGHSPAPNVTIYNTTTLDNDSSPNVRTDQRSPMPNPQPSPRGRPRRVEDEWALGDEMAELRLELAKERRRSRSHSRGGRRHRDSDPAYEQWQLQLANERLRDAEERLQQEKRDELLKQRYELKYLKNQRERDEEEARIKAEEDRMKKDWELKMEREERKREQRAKDAEEERKRIVAQDAQRRRDAEEERKRILAQATDEQRKADEERKRILAEATLRQREQDEERKRILAEATLRQREQDEERKRIVAENIAKLEKADREAKEARQRAVDEFNKKKAEEEKEAKEARDRAIADYERKKSEDEQKAKRQKEELLMQIRLDEEKKKAKEKAEWEAFLLKQKEMEEEEKAKKKKQEEELEEQMRKRLAQFGFQENQIQAMIKPEKAKELQQGLAPINPLQLAPQPTYVKVHKDHLSIDTLTYYDIPWEYDRNDRDYIIILREMDPKETDILFEHTRRLRTRGTSRLLIEERTHHDKPEYAWVRKRGRTPSPHRRRSSPKRVIGIKEMFF